MPRAVIFIAVQAALSLAASPALATWTNQMGNGDSNTMFLAVAAGSASAACATGYINSGQSPQVLYARTVTGDAWSEGGFTGYGGAMAFADESVGFIGGIIGKVWKTTDGGGSWVEIPEATVGGGTLMDSEYVADIAVSPDGQKIWIIGGGGLCAYSTDMGATWTKTEIALPGGEVAVTAGAVLGENVWIVGGIPAEAPVEGSDYEDPTPGHAASNGFVLHSGDGGATFETVASDLDQLLTEVSFINPAEGWASAATFTEGGAAVGYTSDAGATWSFAEVPDLPEDEVFGVGMGASLVPAGCSFVEFFGREVGVAVCTTATFEFDGSTALFLSTDAGASWELQPGYRASFATQMMSVSEIFDVAMADCHRGWLVGAGKVIQRWDNDDSSLDCLQGGAPSEEDIPEDIADPEGGSAEDGCGCEAAGGSVAGSLLAIIASVL